MNRDSYAEGNKVWIGDHDASTAIRHNLAMLEANGTFLESWIERPFLWCLNSNEERISNGDDYKEVNAYVIDELFPAAIREAITPK